MISRGSAPHVGRSGFTSRIVRKLEADELVGRDATGALHVTNPGLAILDHHRYQALTERLRRTTV